MARDGSGSSGGPPSGGGAGGGTGGAGGRSAVRPHRTTSFTTATILLYFQKRPGTDTTSIVTGVTGQLRVGRNPAVEVRDRNCWPNSRRRFLGRAVDQVVLSMRAPDTADTEGEDAEANEEVTPGASSAGGPAGGQGASTWMAGSYRNEFFALDLPPGWEDQSVYLLFEAGKGPVLQNLVVRWDPWESGVFALEERVGDEVEIMRSTTPGFELLAQGEFELADGHSAQQVIFRRSTGGEGFVRQVQTYVPAHDRLYLLTLTGEDEPGEAVEETFASIVRSFALHGGQAVG